MLKKVDEMIGSKLHFRRLSFSACFTLLAGLLLVCEPLSAETPDSASSSKDALSAYYGFKKAEVFKLEYRSATMLAGDLNHDGLTDILITDNSHSRLDLLQQRKKKPGIDPEESGEVNELKNDWRFEHRKIPVDKLVTSMTLGDFNGDSKTDIAYFGAPDSLVIRYQPESGEWTEKTIIRLEDVPAVAWNIASGDLNGDKRNDLVVLGKNSTYIIYQQAEGKLSTPQSLMNTSEMLGLAQIADLDGDGLNDLSYTASSTEERVICARLQTKEGRLGPELAFDLNRPRAITLYDTDGKTGREILTIDSRTNRVKVQRMIKPEPQEGELAGRLIQYGFGDQQSGRDRALAVGDLDGDGLPDVVVTDPAAAQMIVFQQQSGQGLDLGTTFPGFLGANQIRIADLDGDKQNEVVVLSPEEKVLGISRFQKGRLTFPQTLPVSGEPVALELADLDRNGQQEIVYVSRIREGRNSQYALRGLARSKSGKWKPFAFAGKKDAIPIETRSTPKGLLQLDANHDGRSDFLLFFGVDSDPILLVSDKDGVPMAVKADQGIRLGEVKPGSIFVGNLQEPAILVTQKNFARNLKLNDQQQWEVVDQYNATQSNARIAGAATINLDGQPGNEIVLVDTGVKKLRVLKEEGSLYRPWKEVDLGNFQYKSMQVVDLNGDKKEDLLLFSPGKFSVLYSEQTDPKTKEITVFETKLKKTFFADVVAGDLNNDGNTDLALIDTRSHHIELLDLDAKQGLRHALHFKLYEEKSFSRGEGDNTEPRESLIADVTGDGLSDLILLIHDRLLVFPQDDGK